MNISRRLLLFGLLSLTVGCGLAKVTSARVERTTITNHGLFEVGAARTEAAPNTSAGAVHMGESVRLLATTDKVPRRKGTLFGYQFQVEGEPKGTVLPVFIVVDH